MYYINYDMFPSSTAGNLSTSRGYNYHIYKYIHTSFNLHFLMYRRISKTINVNNLIVINFNRLQPPDFKRPQWSDSDGVTA